MQEVSGSTPLGRILIMKFSIHYLSDAQ